MGKSGLALRVQQHRVSMWSRVSPRLVFTSHQFPVAAAVEGTVQVELLDAKTSQPIPNYTRADSEPLFGNFVRRKARWGRPQHWESTARVRASAVQLAVHFRNAKVYSLALNSDSGQSQS